MDVLTIVHIRENRIKELFHCGKRIKTVYVWINIIVSLNGEKSSGQTEQEKSCRRRCRGGHEDTLVNIEIETAFRKNNVKLRVYWDSKHSMRRGWTWAKTRESSWYQSHQWFVLTAAWAPLLYFTSCILSIIPKNWFLLILQNYFSYKTHKPKMCSKKQAHLEISQKLSK